MEFDSGFGKREIPNQVKAFFNDGTNKTIISKKNNLFDVYMLFSKRRNKTIYAGLLIILRKKISIFYYKG
jgi:hypothetical protein